MTPARDRGSMAVEVVVLVPVMLLVLALVVAMGRYTQTRAGVHAAAREAARSATLERDAGSALVAARAAADATLPDGLTCDPARLEGDFVAGGTLHVVVDCEVSWDGLGLVGLPGGTTVRGSAAAPLDEFRATR